MTPRLAEDSRVLEVTQRHLPTGGSVAIVRVDDFETQRQAIRMRWASQQFTETSGLIRNVQKLRSGFMRNRIFGAIGVTWGGLMLVSSFMRGGPQGSGAYAAGQTGALVFAVLLVMIGGYYLAKGSAKK
jgi:hypothetical protein